MSTLDLALRYVRNPDLVATDMDGETVMMSVDHGRYFGIGGVGNLVWQLLAEPVLMSEVVMRVCAEYEVEEAACTADMAAFFSKLANFGLIKAA